MELSIVKNYEELSQRAANKVIAIAESTDQPINISIPAGRTPKGMYHDLVDYVKDHPGCFDHISWYTLDEYINIPKGSALSCLTKLTHLFYEPAGIKKDKIFSFNTEAEDFNKEAERIEALISETGGLRLSILGIGRNGHVGFNEPGSERDSRTRVMTLQAKTLEQSKVYFTEDVLPPKEGITLGIQTLLESEEILLFANSTEKEAIIHEVVEGDISPQVPASFFRESPKAELIIDEEAAKRLSVRK